MIESDKRIGENLRRIRGDMPQKALAAEMKKRGWKWSQPTVAAIETGERPLKLAEAETLVELLGIDEIEELISRPLRSLGWAALERMESANRGLIEALLRYWQAQFDLASIADAHELEGEPLPEESPGVIERWIASDPRTTLDANGPFVPLRPNVVSQVSSTGPFMSKLAAGPYGEYSDRSWSPMEERDGEHPQAP